MHSLPALVTVSCLGMASAYSPLLAGGVAGATARPGAQFFPLSARLGAACLGPRGAEGGLARRGGGVVRVGGGCVGVGSGGAGRLSRQQVGIRRRGVAGGLSMQQQPSGGREEASEGAEYEEALRQTGIIVGLSAAFGAAVWAFKGADSGLEWFAGYLLEESLSVDNLFVFILLFKNFNLSDRSLQKRVLNYGVIGAMVMRALFILVGVAAIESFKPVLLVFAGILVFSSAKMLVGKEKEDESLEDNKVVQFATKLINSTDQYDGDKFWTIVGGVKRATPLLLLLVCIELSDLVFAVDSIPAVFGVTKDPLIVFTSNVAAILGLRSLYTVVNKAMSEIVYLEKSVAVVLGFVGAKMIAEYGGMEISTAASLGIIASILGGGVGLSFISPPTPSSDE